MNPMGTRREKQKAETRELILESARRLFETQGFEKTTIRAVAGDARISLGTIYKHFKNKAALLAAALLGDLTDLYDSAVATMPTNVCIKQQLIHLSRQFYTYYTSRPALARAYLTHLFTLDAQEIAQINAFDKIFAEKSTSLVTLAQKRGEIAADKDSSFVAVSFLADYFYVLGNDFLRYGEQNPEKMLAILENLLDQTIP
jgi:AcrR family transcriptional regulator